MKLHLLPSSWVDRIPRNGPGRLGSPRKWEKHQAPAPELQTHSLSQEELQAVAGPGH